MAQNSSSEARPYPVLEFLHGQAETLETADRVTGGADMSRLAARAVAGSEAFRKYAPLTNRIATSAAGDLRGMVISARWRTVFTFTERAEGAMSNLGYIASVVAGLAEQAPQIERIIASSKDNAVQKGLQLTTIAGTLSLRALTGAVPFGTHVIYLSLEGWAQAAGLVPALAPAANATVQTLQSADTLVQTTFKTWTDTNRLGQAIWTGIEIAQGL